MNITFMIGNGFDLACGLNTRFTDVYEKYVATRQDGDSEAIKKFKNFLDKNHYDYKNWADFEMAIPDIGKNLGNFRDFRECYLDFKKFLVDYLIEQEERLDFENKEKIFQVLHDSAYVLEKHLFHKSSKAIKAKVGSPRLFFFKFNYTKIFDNILSIYDEQLRGNTVGSLLSENLIHIHSKLGNDILLGLDNIDQYKDMFPNEKNDLEEIGFLINKSTINEETTDNEELSSTRIRSSDIVCIFGWSMGDSDQRWVENLRNWFTVGEHKHIVFVPFFDINKGEKKTSELEQDERFKRERKCKKEFCENLDIDESYVDRIHVVLKEGFLDFNFLTKKAEETAQILNKEPAII